MKNIFSFLRLQSVSAIFTLVVFLTASPVYAQSELQVIVDQSVAVNLDGNIDSVFVGNPLIAEVLIQKDGLLFVQGRIPGTTNIVVMDSEGQEISDLLVSVASHGNTNMVLYKASTKYSFNCRPTCDSVAMPGDDEGYFNVVSEQQTQKLSLGIQGRSASTNLTTQ